MGSNLEKDDHQVLGWPVNLRLHAKQASASRESGVCDAAAVALGGKRCSASIEKALVSVRSIDRN
jgi:hypothetical protein